MATDLANLVTIRSNYIAAQLAASANPQASYSAGGRSWDWAGYHAYLQKLIDDLSNRIIKERGSVQTHTQVLG